MSAAQKRKGPEALERLPSRVTENLAKGKTMNKATSTTADQPGRAAALNNIAALIMIARAAKAAMDNAADDDSVESDDFDVLVNNFDQAVRALASAPTATIEDIRAKARFLLWIDTDEEGNQLRDTSFVSRFLTELAGRDFTDSDEAKFWEAAE